MGREFRPPFPALKRQMASLGERLRMARLRRGLTTILFAQRMGISRDTLNRLEKGGATIALGTYARALRVLGLDGDLDAIARDDVLGRKLQDLKLTERKTRKAPHTGAANPVDPTEKGKPLARRPSRKKNEADDQA